MEKKNCKKCNAVKELYLFPTHKASKDGYENTCKECKKADRIKYREENKTKISDYKKRWDIKNDLHRKEYAENYNIANRKDITIQQNKYRQTPKGKAIYLEDGRRRSQHLRDGDVTTKQITELIENSKTCFYCSNHLSDMHIDHYIPLSKGGRHTITNLVVSCPSCNLKKGSKMPKKLEG